MMADVSEPSDGTPQIQSVGRATALLRCFVETDEPLTLTELARATDMNPSTALRLLRTLCQGGVLRRDLGSEKYMRGPVLLALAQRAYQSTGMADALGMLESLVAATGESASLGIREGRFAVVLLRAESEAPLHFDRPAGTRVPLHLSAMGKALLAFGPLTIPEAVGELGPLESRTGASITKPAQLETVLRKVRDQGYALADEEQYAGVRSVGAPILDRDGVARAAIAIQGPTARISDAELTRYVDAVKATAAEIALLPTLHHLGPGR